MPKIDINFSNTIIYKISCKNPSITDIYIGYTTNFVQRKHMHKNEYLNVKSINYNNKLYNAIRNNGGWENWIMEKINDFNFKDNYEAKEKVNEYVFLLNATLNQTEKTITENQNKDIEKNNKNESKYTCYFCHYETNKKNNYSKHILTIKHKNNKKQTEINVTKSEKIIKEYICNDCGKIYNGSSGLYKHKQKQKHKQEDKHINVNTSKLNDIDFDKELLLEIIKKDLDIKDFLVEQNNKLMEQNTKLMLFAESNKTNIISNTIVNNNFNLNVFLNEKCKDALNITDFVDSLVLGINDLEETARLGYVNGISKIFINGLKKLDIYKRPLHCSDIKRNTLYIKDDNQWAKENNDKPTLTKAIKKVSTKNIQNIFEWQKLNPYYTDSHSKQNDKYNKIICETMSGSSKEEQLNNYDKIIKNVIKEVVIDKE